MGSVAPLITEADTAAVAEGPLVDGWQRVPHGSTFQVSARRATAHQSVTGAFEILASDGEFNEHLLDTANGAALETSLRAPERYSSDLLLHFDTAATVSIVASIIKPEGATHGEPYTNVVTREAGQDVFISFFVFTLK